MAADSGIHRRWRGINTPDVGGNLEEVAAVERQLGVMLPPSAKEFVAFANDFYDMSKLPPHPRYCYLFPCKVPHLDNIRSNRAVSLIYYTFNSTAIGVAHEDLANANPPTYWFHNGHTNAIDPEGLGMATFHPTTRELWQPSLSLAIFRSLVIDIPAAGSMAADLLDLDDFLDRLAVDFPIQARFDDARGVRVRRDASGGIRF